jgi:hypothetical protein
MSDILKGIIETNDEIILIDRDLRKKFKKDNTIEYQFECELFVGAATGVVVLENMDVLTKLFQGFDKTKKKSDMQIIGGIIRNNLDKAVPLMFQIFESILKPQYDFMTAEWCEKNMKLTDAIKILVVIITDLVDFVKGSGLMGGAPEAETPEKNPKDTD